MPPSEAKAAILRRTQAEAILRRRFPMIHWNRPLHVATVDAQGYACRYCVAIFGLAAHEIPDLPQTFAAFTDHLRAMHQEGADDAT